MASAFARWNHRAKPFLFFRYAAASSTFRRFADDRFAAAQNLMKSTEELHRSACESGEITYPDPQTGYAVLTAFYLTQRGHCCDNGCRHCPYQDKCATSAEKRSR